MIRGDHPNSCPRIRILNRAVAEVGVDFDIAEITGNLAVLNQNRTERERIGSPLRQQLGRRNLFLVIGLHRPVLEQRHSVPHRIIPVHRAITDNHAVFTEAVVIAVDREQRIVACGNLRSNLCDVRAEAVFGKSGMQAAGILKHDISDKVSDLVGAGPRLHLFNIDLDIVAAVAPVIRSSINLGGSSGGGSGRIA
ncbi:hypothetical protein D3C75_830830 [compost metagenome]